MKKENSEVIEAYKIRIDALEIMNEAYLAKIEALEMLNRNLQFLRDVRRQGQVSSPSGNQARPINGLAGEKRGRGRPRKYFPATDQGTGGSAQGGDGPKRGRGRPRKYPVGHVSVKPGSILPSGERRGRGRPKKNVVKPEGAVAVVASAPKKRGPKTRNSNITRLQVPLDAWLRETLKDEGFNKATFRAITGILLCMFENNTATVSNLHEYIGGSRVTVVRHTAFLKKMKLITYEGSRKKGHYALTPQGTALYERLANA